MHINEEAFLKVSFKNVDWFFQKGPKNTQILKNLNIFAFLVALSTCRLINPAKTDVGRLSKRILEEKVAELREKLQLNQSINFKCEFDRF